MEYISRESAIAMYEDDGIDMSALKVPVPVIIQNLKDVPAADVRPVERGKWTRHDFSPIGHDYQCSECGWNNDMASRFCPNCGADMREVEHD